jgi:hypothetical protein
LAEFEDHLACDPEAKLGDPRQLAVEFSDQLATQGARRSGSLTFGALALTGLALVASQAAVPTYPGIFDGRAPILGVIAVLFIVVASQVALVAGSLSLLRALRMRRETVVPAAEVELLRRRTAVALGAGGVTAVGMILDAFNSTAQMPTWWTALTVSLAAIALLALAAATLDRSRTSSIVVSQPGGAGGFEADLGPFARSMLIGVLVVLGVLTMATLAESSILEGAERALAEAVFFFSGLLLLGRMLGLRRHNQPSSDR